MQEDTNWYWDHKQQQQVIIIPTRTIVHPCLDVLEVKYVHDIAISVNNRNQAKQDLQRHPIFWTEDDHNYI